MNNEISVLQAERINTPDITVIAKEALSLDDNSLDNNAGKVTHSNINVTSYSFQESISRAIGHYVICEFMVGSNQMSIREGILREVGQSYFILYNEDTDTSISCDFYSLKFITFYRNGIKPKKGLG